MPDRTARIIKNHDTDTDVLRLLAAFGVVVIHICDFACLWNVFYNALSHFSVPVFVLISGWYLLDRELTGRQLAGRIARLLGRMFVWSAIYYAAELLMKTQQLGLRSAVTYLLTQPGHLWYQYALTALLLLTPPLQVFSRHAEKKTYRYVLALTFLLGSVLTIALRTGKLPLTAAVTEKMKLPYTQGFVFLYLLGGYFKRFGIERPKLWYALGAAGLAVTTALSKLLPFAQATNLVLSFFAPNTMAMGIAAFVLVKQLFSGRQAPEKAARLLKAAGADTEGIYYIHELVILLMKPTLAAMVVGLPRPVQMPLKALTVFALSMASIAILRRIPVLSWLCGKDRRVSK